MSSQAHSKLKRDVRSMPNWVGENNQRMGPKPPTPPVSNGNHIAPALPPKSKTQEIEPDYEVIEFSGQQYSNEPMRGHASARTKTPDTKIKCTLCGSNNPWVTCDECAQQIFCASCDNMYHKHPKRKDHVRKAIEQNARPPLPPKTLPGQPGPTGPIAPPRRSKRGIMTPLLQRKDQVTMSSQLQAPPSPTPSLKSNSWQDRVGSLKHGMNLLNRPLPDPPKTSATPESETSRSTTPRSAFDAIQRPPSVQLEKIKSKANATLDRMAILQQRYRQQKEEQQRNRSDSVSSQNLSFDQWANISPSPSNFRSGSMSSGLNSSHFDLSDDLHFNFNHQRQPQQQMNRPRNMSSSVFNLSQLNRPTPHQASPASPANSWAMSQQMQQAQSMAQLSCMGCQTAPQWAPQHTHNMGHNMHADDFNSRQQLNRSNLSLNMPAGQGYVVPGHHMHHQHGYPPPVFMNQRAGMMYPYPYNGMPVMSPGVMGMPPPSRSRATSRAGSRGTSPAMSRKSMTLRRKRTSSFVADDDATDDEDSDQDDRRSLISNRSYMTSASRSGQRQRRISNVTQPAAFEDAEGETMHNRRNKNNDRRGSNAKSVQSDWVTTRRSTGTLKPNKIYSDLDSEGSGTRALVQAKIQEKLAQTARKGKSHKRSSGSESVDEKPKPLKVSTEVQAGAVRSKAAKTQQTAAAAVATSKKVPSESEEFSVEEKLDVDEVVDKDAEESEATKANDDEKETSDKEDSAESQRADTLTAEDAQEDDELGPPPSTPDYEWECEFCTFVNEPNIKICTICCKTPNTTPKRHKTTPSPPPKVNKVAAKPKTSLALKNETHRPSTSQPNLKSVPKAEKKESPIKTITNGVSKLKVTSSENESDQCNNNTQSGSSGSGSKLKSTQKKPVKDTIEDIWTALDENIQATADEVIRKSRVSTGCGTSPPPQSSNNQIEETTNDVSRLGREIGTSPPPQSISTQTYDVFPVKKSELPIEKETLNNGPTPILNNPQHFESYNNFNGINPITDSKLSPWTTLDHLSQQNQRIPDNFREKEDRYRSVSDLRHRDTDSPQTSYGLGRRQSSYAELLTSPRTQSQISNTGTFSNFDMPRYESKPARDPETELYILLKEAEMYKYTPEELHAALKNCGPDTHPVQWLRDNWPKLIQTVRSLATKYGQERIENTIGTISQQEAREALRMHGGNIWQAVSECIEQRQRKYRDISSKGNFSREDIVTALTTHQGNAELALMDLGRTQLKPFLMRIWGSPGGVENESVSNAYFQSPQTPLSDTSSITSHDNTIKNDIHEFLSANASECLQTPSISGAFMRDFHSPIQTHDLNNVTANIEGIHSYPNMSTNCQEQADDTFTYNRHMLKDLETLIGNIEQNQAKQNKEVLLSIEGMLGQLINKRDTDQDMDPEAKRILMKSPITTPKVKPSQGDSETLDIKTFVWQNIQEIVPSLVQQVKAELNEGDSTATPVDPPETNTVDTPEVQSDKFIMEEIIQPNIKEASFREELPPEFFYAAEISNFRMEFDRGLEREHEHEYELDSTEDAIRHVYKMFVAPIEDKPKHKENEYVKEESKNQPIFEAEQIAPGIEPKNIEEPVIPDETVQEEQPSTSKAALSAINNNSKAAKQLTKTGIPKLQEKSQAASSQPVRTAKSKEKSPHKSEKAPKKAKQSSKQTKHEQDVASNADKVPVQVMNQQESILEQKPQMEKRQIKSKIPIRRTINFSSNNKEEVLNTSNGAQQREESIASDTPNGISPVLKQHTLPENEQSKSEVSVEPAIAQAEEVFQDLDELSSNEENIDFKDNVQEEIVLLKDDNDENDNDETSSGEEELFSAGSGSVHTSQNSLNNSKSISDKGDVDALSNDIENHKSPDLENETVENARAEAASEEVDEENYQAVSKQSKKNLSKLVSDTQLLIKQMKDEITLDEFSSSDEDDYSEDYSVEYDGTEDDDDDWEEEEDGEDDEEEDDLDYENDEELASVFEEDENVTDTEEDKQLATDDNQAHTNDTTFPTDSPTNTPNIDISTSITIDEIMLEVENNQMNVSAVPTNEEASIVAIEIEAVNAENSIPEPLVEVLLESLRGEPMSMLLPSPTSPTIDVDQPSNPNNQETIVPAPSEIQLEQPENTQSNQMLMNSINAATVELDAQDTALTTTTTADLPSAEEVIAENSEEVASDPINISLDTSSINFEAILAATMAINETNDTNDAITESTSETNVNEVNAFSEIPLTDTGASTTQNALLELTNALESNNNFAMADSHNEVQEEIVNSSTSASSFTTSHQQPSQNEDGNLNTSRASAEVTVTTEPLNDTQSIKRVSKIPKPKENSPKHASKKVPMRSKSFSGPPTPIGISSVKAIQQQYLNKQSQLSPSFLQPKVAQPVVRKKSITEAINKLTRPAKDNAATTNLDGPSTSSGIFRPRAQMRIPKKKYHETCFSDDDYETTSSEEEPEMLEVLQRKRSVPVFRAYPSMQEPEEVNPEELSRKLVEENLVSSIAEAQIAATLVSMKFQQDVSIWAAKECSDLEQAIALLKHDCELCMGTYPLNQIVSMLKCTHKCCKQCAKTYFTVQITDRSINDCNCPFCKLPELHNESGEHEDEHLEYFSNLDIFLKNILDAEVHELFQRKLRDRSLQQDPNFKWCVECSSGFFARPKQKRLICPDCGSVTCSQCRKKWEKQHEGISCDQFKSWKDANDPEIQAQGVQEHLATNGIDCPKCKFRYSLARGGCMHFTCTQCKFEFCFGCARPFMMGAKCNISPYCAKLGLHAHHPRNCLFYLRDKIPLQLQFLLKENGVSFDVEPTDNINTQLCPIPIQRETPNGLYDTVCNSEVPDKHAGMCRTHYVEYLTAKVAKAGIDPLPIFDLTDCVQELRRRGIALPERGPWDTDEIYKNMCAVIIKKNIPLESS